MKSMILSVLAVSCAAMPQAAAPSVTPSPTLGSNNIHTLMALGYNPAQASYYASVITQPAVKSAYEALASEGAIDKLNGATAEAEYNSILMDAVASLPDDLRAPATSFFGGLEMLGASVTAAQASASSSASAQSVSDAISSNSKTVTTTGSLLFASMPATMSAAATGSAQGSSSTPASSANASQSHPSSSVSQAAAAPRQTNLAIGAVIAGAIGLAAAL